MREIEANESTREERTEVRGARKEAEDAAERAAERDERHARAQRRAREALGGRAPQRMGRLYIGQMEGGTRAPTTPTPRGAIDMEADRRTLLGCFYKMPSRRRGRRWELDERYRPLVVAATALQLEQTRRQGWADVDAIAGEGPERRGWWIEGQRVQLQVSQEMRQRDPHGRQQAAALEEVAQKLSEGQGVRMLCHCRWQRAEGEGCKGCHLQPTAAHVERVATAKWQLDRARETAITLAAEEAEEERRHPTQGSGGGSGASAEARSYDEPATTTSSASGSGVERGGDASGQSRDDAAAAGERDANVAAGRSEEDGSREATEQQQSRRQRERDDSQSTRASEESGEPRGGDSGEVGQPPKTKGKSRGGQKHRAGQDARKTERKRKHAAEAGAEAGAEAPREG